MKLIRKILVLLMCMTGSLVVSQELFTIEFGGHGGIAYLNGDYTPSASGRVQRDFGLTFRRIFNPRLSLMLDYHFYNLNDNATQPLSTLFNPNVVINQQLHLADVLLAFNFLEYGRLDHIMNSSNFTPFLTAGLGLVGENQRTGLWRINPTLPIGFGAKIQLAKRVHLNLQWIYRFSLSDDGLEGLPDLDNKLNMNGSNLFNNDQVGSFTAGISIGLFKKDCKCMNYN